MGHQPSPDRAAHNIIQRSFGLRPDQDLLIFADLGSLEAANLVAETARRCGVFATVFFVPHLIQSEFSPNESLPLPSNHHRGKQHHVEQNKTTRQGRNVNRRKRNDKRRFLPLLHPLIEKEM